MDGEWLRVAAPQPKLSRSPAAGQMKCSRRTVWRVSGPRSILPPLGWTHGLTAVAMALPVGTFPSCAPPLQPGPGKVNRNSVDKRSRQP